MKKRPSGEGLGEIVRTVARWLNGIILTYGIYIVLYGHITPGGGFAGGVIIACGFILLTLAGGQEQGLSFFSKKAASALDSIGVLLFLALALVAIWATGTFLENFIGTSERARFTLFSGGIMPIANIGLGLKVASSLFLAFTVLAAFQILPSSSKEEEEDL